MITKPASSHSIVPIVPEPWDVTFCSIPPLRRPPLALQPRWYRLHRHHLVHDYFLVNDNEIPNVTSESKSS